MFTTLKANIYAIVAGGFVILLGALKYLSMTVKQKDTEIDKIKASIDTAVKVNTDNAKTNEVKDAIKHTKVVADAASDDDTDSVLLNKYTRNGDKN